tara:strand:+ start:633 stop:1586 length:954 start_codon:yes stop_codon:yes gene_type:complete
MNILSLFDGMSCGRIAAERAGFDVENYYASELDKYAITVTQANWPNTIQLGDVTKWREWDIDWANIDLLIGGSPCQGFSFAGKQLAFDDPRSALFFEYMNILNHIKAVNPNVKFMLENVKMKQEYLDVISSMVGVDPVFINSALVSAQNRKRYYWANWDFYQPRDEDINLIDCLEDEVDIKFIHTQKALDYMDRAVKGGRNHWDFKHHSDVRNDKSQCITANTFKGVPYSAVIAFRENLRAKSKCVRSGGRGSFDRHEWDSADKIHVRKFTPTECERLQTVPDNYTNHVSNTQRYKMLGNGWTVDVIVHIFKSLIRL